MRRIGEKIPEPAPAPAPEVKEVQKEKPAKSDKKKG